MNHLAIALTKLAQDYSLIILVRVQYVCIHVVYMFIHACFCIHVCVIAIVHVCTCAHTCVHVIKFVCVSICMFTFMCVIY